MANGFAKLSNKKSLCWPRSRLCATDSITVIRVALSEVVLIIYLNGV